MATSPLSLLLLLVLTLSFSAQLTTPTTLPILSTNAPSTSTTSLPSLLSADQSRLLYLSSLATAIPAPSPRPRPRRRSYAPIASGNRLLSTPTYVVRATLGTPPQPLLLSLDTSSDVAWVPYAAFSPSRSTSFKPVPCGSPQCSQIPSPSCPPLSHSCVFNFTYGSSSVAAALSQDTLSIASDAVRSYTFGSITKSTGSSVLPQGLLGLGRGPLSFLTQTKSLYSSTFSYCLPSFRSANFSGTLRLGPSGQPVRIKTTPLLSNPRRSSLYYVKLLRIRVGRHYLTFPPEAIAHNPATGAGTIFDSGTMFTRLVAPAYAAVRDEFRRRVNRTVTSLGGFDTCYHGPIRAPTVTFEFVGMNMTLGMENTMIHSTSGDLACLAMAAAPENLNSVLNVIANMQQQNHRMLFDLPNGRIGVAREPCTS